MQSSSTYSMLIKNLVLLSSCICAQQGFLSLNKQVFKKRLEHKILSVLWTILVL